jgi:hypothetical protein
MNVLLSRARPLVVAGILVLQPVCASAQTVLPQTTSARTTAMPTSVPRAIPRQPAVTQCPSKWVAAGNNGAKADRFYRPICH